MTFTPEVANLVQELIPQARSEAWRAFQQARHVLDREELESIAYLGLMQAAQRWPLYCEENGFSPGCGNWPCTEPETCGTRYFGAYCSRRMRGAILDFQRQADWVPRATRQRAKALRDAGSDFGVSEEALMRATSLTQDEIRSTNAAVALRPVSIDDGDRDVASAASTESQAMTAGILHEVVVAMRGLPVRGQVIVAMRFFEGRELKEIAVILGMPEGEVSRLHSEGVLHIHEAMVRSARIAS